MQGFWSTQNRKACEIKVTPVQLHGLNNEYTDFANSERKTGAIIPILEVSLTVRLSSSSEYS